MSVLIFKLRYVPDDEAYEVRQLLIDNHIDYFETSAGVLGISMPGLWLKDEAQLARARQLIDAYQQQRQDSAREDYEHSLRQGTARTFVDMFREAPVRYIIFILGIILLSYLMLSLFFHL